MFKRFLAILVSLLVLSSGVYASGSATSDTVQTKKHTVKEKAHKAPQKNVKHATHSASKVASKNTPKAHKPTQKSSKQALAAAKKKSAKGHKSAPVS
ncbi:hypothetical protein [Sulfurospirillum cavolei]|uniref:hypothetical protein n=1 Tax=Sulfurospirillum cavolei TaxID=366522 RepID=UPI003FA2AB3E